MRARVALQTVCAALALGVGLAWAGEPAAIDRVDAGVHLVDTRKEQGYRDVMAQFDAAMQASPDDPALAVSRCRFVGRYTDDEVGDWIATATDDYESCLEDIKRRFPKAPQVQLFEMEQMWGDEVAELGESLLASAGEWPTPYSQELLVRTSVAQEYAGHKLRAGELAVMAVDMGDVSRVAAAVQHLARLKQFARATALLNNASPAEEPWEGKGRVEAALALPDDRAALRELHRHPKVAEAFQGVAARAYLRAGDVAAARRALSGTSEKDTTLRALRFDLALASNDFDTAARQVDFSRKQEFQQNLARFAMLLVRAPATLAAPNMQMAALICLMMVAAAALVPGLLLLPVHYRGLARRLNGKTTTPLFASVGLWRAWYATVVAVCVPLAVGLLVEPTVIASVMQGERPSGAGVFRAMLWGETAALLCLPPALRGLQPQQLLGDRAALRSWWIVLAGVAGLLALGWLLAVINAQLGTDADTDQTRMVFALAKSGVEAVGPFATLLLMALLVPVFEELVFRGLLLGGLSRHVGFGAANLIQALAFALVHGDPPRLPYYFAMGLLGGWLVKRTNSLGPTIALHALNNAVAAGSLLVMIGNGVG